MQLMKAKINLLRYHTIQIFVAYFTTAHARLRLYEVMEKLNHNVCYVDTDSIIYIENEESKKIIDKYLGESLGQWTDELNGKSIDYWICCQAKGYGYIQSDGKEVGKVKGFRVNADAENKMTNKQRKALINKSIDVEINYQQSKIKDCEIFTKNMKL